MEVAIADVADDRRQQSGRIDIAPCIRDGSLRAAKAARRRLRRGTRSRAARPALRSTLSDALSTTVRVRRRSAAHWNAAPPLDCAISSARATWPPTLSDVPLNSRNSVGCSGIDSCEYRLQARTCSSSRNSMRDTDAPDWMISTTASTAPRRSVKQASRAHCRLWNAVQAQRDLRDHAERALPNPPVIARGRSRWRISQRACRRRTMRPSASTICSASTLRVIAP